MQKITAEQIDALLPFLEQFEQCDFSAGEWEHQSGQLPWYNFDDAVLTFRQQLNEHGWVTPSFDWTKWKETAKEYMESPEKVELADTKTIQKLFTTHVRSDRFCEGHLAAMFESGHIVLLLRRLKSMRGSME